MRCQGQIEIPFGWLSKPKKDRYVSIFRNETLLAKLQDMLRKMSKVEPRTDAMKTSIEEMLKNPEMIEKEFAAYSDTDGSSSLAESMIKDSAFVLAAATALLYLTSLVIGSVYFRFFGIPMGFQSFGVGNLALLSPAEFCIAIVFALQANAALLAVKWYYYALGSVIFIAVGASQLIVTIFYGLPVGLGDCIYLFIAILSIFVLTHARMRMRVVFSKAQNGISLCEDRLPKIKKAELGVTGAAMATVVEVSHRWFRKRVRQMKTMAWVLSAYLTMAVMVPALTWFLALMTAHEKSYVETSANAGVQLPVYAIEDRVMYLSREGKKCLLNIQMSEDAKFKRLCAPMASAVFVDE